MSGYQSWINSVTGKNVLNINRTLLLIQYKSHPSKHSLYDFDKVVQHYDEKFDVEWRPFLVEYVDTLAQTIFFGCLLYFVVSCLDYILFYILFPKKFLPTFKDQEKFVNIKGEIWSSLVNIGTEAFLIAWLRMMQPRYSMIYFNVSDYGWSWIPISLLLQMLWDETLTYWVHRWLHTYKFLYRHLHYIHHSFVSVTPFCGFAFHPLDAFFQAVPMFTSCFIFPLQYDIMLIWSVFTTLWAISIHDNVPTLPCKLFLYSTHHTIHHKGWGLDLNYGKFTSIWDRIMGTYKDPKDIYYGYQSTIKFQGINDALEKFVPEIGKKNKKD